jgi:ankyrin repeat protein
MHYASESGSANLVLLLTNRGAGVDPTDSLERTPLMIAIENNKADLAKTLIGLGARVSLLDVFGRTPLMYACKVASPEIVDLLIK